eukprot:jgi/Chlat1/1244/Chrsp115S00756
MAAAAAAAAAVTSASSSALSRTSASSGSARPWAARQTLPPAKPERRRRCLSNARPAVRAEASVSPSSAAVRREPSVVAEQVTAFAPATIANLGPGFDFLGVAVEGGGDEVDARALPDRPGEVVIESVSGDGGRLSLDPLDNCAGVAAAAVLRRLMSDGSSAVVPGVALTLRKGLPLGSGMGSSAASAAAAAWAVNALLGEPLSKEDLVPAGLEAEAAVSGYHADNVGPAIMGGFLLIRSYDPLELIRLPYGGNSLWFVLVTPDFEAPTKQMRAVLAKEVSMHTHVVNAAQGAALTNAILTGNAALLGSCLDSDTIVQPVREPLIPGFAEVRVAALKAGAYGCAISGAGPTAVAVVDDEGTGRRAAAAMVDAFRTHGGLDAKGSVGRLDSVGARTVKVHR